MASLLTGINLIEGLGFYAVVFPFILVTAVIYGILSKLQPFGENNTVNIVIAAMFGVIFVAFAKPVNIINKLIPYMSVLLIIIFLVMLTFMFMGIKMETIQDALEHPAVYGLIIGIVLLGIMIFISQEFAELSPSAQLPTEGEISDSGVVVSDSGSISSGSESTATVSSAELEKLRARQKRLRETIFHPTVVSLIVLLLVFGAATYVITAVREK